MREKLDARLTARPCRSTGVNTSLERSRGAQGDRASLYRHSRPASTWSRPSRLARSTSCARPRGPGAAPPPDEALAGWMRTSSAAPRPSAACRMACASCSSTGIRDLRRFPEPHRPGPGGAHQPRQRPAPSARTSPPRTCCGPVRHLFRPGNPGLEARSRRIVSLIMDGLRWGAAKGGSGE